MKTLKLGKFEINKENAYHLGLSLATVILGVLTLYGWLMEVVVDSVTMIDRMGSFRGDTIEFVYVISLLAGLLGMVLMVACIVSCAVDAFFTLQGKGKPLFSFIQGGSALLSWVLVAGSTFLANMVTYFYLADRWGADDVSIFTSYVSAGMIIWAVLILSVVKVAIGFLFKEEKQVEEVNDLGPIE